MAPASSRRSARESAVGLLYEAEIRGQSPLEVARLQAVAVDPYTEDVVKGVTLRRQEIDDRIRAFSRSWAVDRMPAVDRAILRIAVWELVERPDVPTAVAISEAVEIAKRYSTEDSGRFVNGLLAAIAEAVESESDHQRRV